MMILTKKGEIHTLTEGGSVEIRADHPAALELSETDSVSGSFKLC